MTADFGPYARLYLCIPDDPKFESVYDNDQHFATYCRLLMIAEGPWPASAHLPAIALRDSVEKLANVGLIDLQPGGRYRIHGLDAERARRSENGRNAAAVRWQSKRIPTPDADPMPRRDETSKDETSISRVNVIPDDGREDLEAWLVVKHRAPSPKQRDVLDTYCRVFDQTGPARAAGLIYRNPADPIAALLADLEAFRQERAAAAPAAAEKPARRGPSASVLTAAHNNGYHEANPDERCAYCREDVA